MNTATPQSTDKPTMEEKRLKKNERNKLYYVKNKERIRQRVQEKGDIEKRKDYYNAHKDVILKNQRNNYKKRSTNNRVNELKALLESADDSVKVTINKLLEKPSEINKHDVNTIKKLVEKVE
jgi:hypothetical protein